MGLLAFSVASFSSKSRHLFTDIKMGKLTTGGPGSGSSGDFSLFEKLTASDFNSVLISRNFSYHPNVFYAHFLPGGSGCSKSSCESEYLLALCKLRFSF